MYLFYINMNVIFVYYSLFIINYVHKETMIKNYSILSQLNEVKKDQTGTGLLIENDGHIINHCDTVQQIKEDINAGHKFVIPDRFILPALFQKYNIKNANGRIYPEAILRKEVDEYINERVNKHCAIGALDHPQSSSLSGHDVAINIIELYWKNQTLLGNLELVLSEGFRRTGVCSTSGDLVATYILNGIQLGVSSRGVGSVKKEGNILMVDNDYEIICWDVVCEPSTPNAWIKNSVEELMPFVESSQRNDTPINEKLNRLEKILL